jgi:hypothetical protein
MQTKPAPENTNKTSNINSNLDAAGSSAHGSASPGIANPETDTPTARQAAGRPPVFCREIVALLCHLIAETGVSDSGAAYRARLSTSTLSRWKREKPKFRLALLQAREKFRVAQLDVILEASRAQRSGSWRAAAWLLERIFPEDYSPRAAERQKFQDLAAAREAFEEVEEDDLDRPNSSSSFSSSSSSPNSDSQNCQNTVTPPTVPPSGPPPSAPVADVLADGRAERSEPIKNSQPEVHPTPLASILKKSTTPILSSSIMPPTPASVATDDCAYSLPKAA